MTRSCISGETAEYLRDFGNTAFSEARSRAPDCAGLASAKVGTVPDHERDEQAIFEVLLRSAGQGKETTIRWVSREQTGVMRSITRSNGSDGCEPQS